MPEQESGQLAIQLIQCAFSMALPAALLWSQAVEGNRVSKKKELLSNFFL